MDGQQIIMNYTVSPGSDDLEVIAGAILEALPDELLEFCDGLSIRVDDLPDEAIENDLDLEDPYDLLALYRSGKEISPGVEKKTANDDDVLIVFRRSLLDMWCESGEDLTTLVRRVMIEELGRIFDFTDEEINEMNERHYQGML